MDPIHDVMNPIWIPIKKITCIFWVTSDACSHSKMFIGDSVTTQVLPAVQCSRRVPRFSWDDVWMFLPGWSSSRLRVNSDVASCCFFNGHLGAPRPRSLWSGWCYCLPNCHWSESIKVGQYQHAVKVSCCLLRLGNIHKCNPWYSDICSDFLFLLTISRTANCPGLQPACDILHCSHSSFLGVLQETNLVISLKDRPCQMMPCIHWFNT